MGENQKILVVEDDRLLALGIKKNLTRMGYSVSDAVSSGEDAIKKAEKTRPNLVLMDVKLKGKMDGIQAAEKIRERLDIPVVYLTAYADKKTLERAKVTEPFGYLTKPFDNDKLRSTIEIALYRSGMEKKLKESEERFRSVVQAASDAIISADKQGNIVFWNHAAEAMFGYTVDEAVGRPLTSILPERFIKPHQKGMKRAVATGDSNLIGETVELSGLRKDGSEFLLELSLAKRETKEGVFFDGIIRDITERRRAEEALHLTRFSVNQASDAIFWMHPDGRFFDVNDAACNKLGYSREELLSMGVSDVDPDYRVEAWQEFLETIKDRGRMHIEAHHRHKDGWVFPMEIAAVFAEFDGQEFVCFIARDISERKRVEGIIRESEEKLREYSEHLEETVALRTKELGLLQRVNNLLNSGATPEEVYGVIAEGLATVFHYHISGIYTLDGEGTHLICKGYHADSKMVKKIEKLTGLKALNQAFPLLEDSMLTQIVEAKKPVITEDIAEVVRGHTDKSTVRAMAKTIAKVSGTKWGIGVPLLAGEKVMGVIGVGSRMKLTDEDASRLAFFGDQVGLALEKSRMGKALEEEVTERRRAEEKIQDFTRNLEGKVLERTAEIKLLKEFNENIVQSMEEGILMLDSKEHITYLNPRCTGMLGYPDKALIGVHWTKIVPRGYHGEMEGKSQEWGEGKKNKFECTLTTQGGKDIPVIVSARPLFEEGAYNGSLLVLTDITEVKARERKLMGQKMTYDVRNGEVYLIADRDTAKTMDIYRDLLNYGYSGVVITRRRPETVRERLGEGSKIFWMSGTDGEDTVSPNFMDIMQVIKDHLMRDTVVLLDRFEYLILQRGFRDSVVFIHELVDLFYGSEAILMVSLDPRTLGEEQLAILEDEMRGVELRIKISLPEGGVEFLSFVHEQNNAGRRPSITDVVKGLGLSKPTVIKRTRILRGQGLLKESKQGRRKLLEVTDQGKHFL
ncbi:MAG: PAS domain S-box protein [Candidatus Hydrothermarchaeales archaeon]